MLGNIWLQLVFILIAIGVFVYLTVKGTSPIVAGLISAALVSIVAIGGFAENFFGTFITGMTGMFGTFFILFTFGTVFGIMLYACGASDRLGVTIVRWLGEENFIFAIIIVTFLVGMTGAPPLAVMPPLCFTMLKKANLPRYVAMAAVGGCTAIATTSMPGTLGAGNVIAATMLGTNVYAGWGIGLIASAVGIVLLCLYLKNLIKRCRKNLIGYDPVGTGMMGGEMREESDMPSFALSIIPVVIVIGGCAALILAAKWSSLFAAATSLTAGVLFLIIFNRKYFRAPILSALRDGANGIQANIVGAITVCGFASVIANTNLFGSLLGALNASTLSPYVLAVVGTFVIAALCADCIGGVAVTLSTLGQTLIAKGAAPAIVHRLVNIASSTFDTMPHGGAVILALSMFGYNHKQGYKYIAVVQIVIPVIFTLVALLCVAIAF